MRPDPLPSPALLRILIIEDSPFDAELLERQLRKDGLAFESRRVEDRESLMRALAEFPPDIVLSDFDLPSLNGNDVIDIMRECRPDIPVIVVSGTIGESVAVETLKRGAADYVMKDNLIRLAPGIRRALAEFAEHERRVKAEAALKESETRFRLAIESSPMGLHMYRLEGDGRLVFIGANKAADRILGVSNEQFIGKTIEQAFPALVSTEVPEIYRRIARAGEVWRSDHVAYEHALIHGAFEVVAFQLRPNEMASMFWDVTEKKKAEVALRRLASAINDAAESVVITDRKGVIEFVNPCFETLTGYSAAEIVGKPVGILKSGFHDAAFYAEVWNTLAKGNPWRGVFVNRRKDGSLFEEQAVISPVRNVDGEVTHYVAVERDMTREREMERRVMQSQKMAALGQLAHRIAHDTANQLTTIMGVGGLLVRRMEAGDQRSMVQDILDSGSKIAELSASLMAFAMPADMKLRKLRLDRVIGGMRDMIGRASTAYVEVSFDLPDACEVNMDSALIEQAVMHIVVNSLESITGFGSIRLCLRKGRMQAAIEEPSVSFEGKEIPAAVLEVIDTGCGISKEDLPRVFEPFFTTKKALRRNAGLGLCTVFNIVERHNGTITMDSEVGKGTTTRIALPLAQ